MLFWRSALISKCQGIKLYFFFQIQWKSRHYNLYLGFFPSTYLNNSCVILKFFNIFSLISHGETYHKITFHVKTARAENYSLVFIYPFCVVLITFVLQSAWYVQFLIPKYLLSVLHAPDTHARRWPITTPARALSVY